MDQLLFPSNSMTWTCWTSGIVHWTWNKSAPNRSIVLLSTNWASHTGLLPWTQWFFWNTSFSLFHGAPAAVSAAPEVAPEGISFSRTETLCSLIRRSCCGESRYFVCKQICPQSHCPGVLLKISLFHLSVFKNKGDMKLKKNTSWKHFQN